MKRLWPGRLMLLASSSLLALCAGELALRWWFRGTVDQMLASRVTGVEDAGRRILCIGDSYTFGLYYRSEESYPGRLQQMLNLDSSGPPTAVINAGIPAQNTAQIAAALPEQLALFEPQVVVLMAGHNNRWNLADPRRRSAVQGFLDDLVLVRLWRIATTPDVGAASTDRISSWSAEQVGVSVAGETSVIEIDKTLDRRDDAALIESCHMDYSSIWQSCQAAGAALVVASYPSPEPGYEAPAEAARQFAKDHPGVLLADCRRQFEALLAERPYHELLIPGDRHPTDRGHYWLARRLMAVLEVARLAALPAGLGDLPEALYPARIEVHPDQQLRLKGPPGSGFQVLLARSNSPPQSFGSLTIPVADDDIFQQFRERDELKGSLDSSGVAEVRLPPEAAEAQVAAVVIFHDLRLKVPELLVREVSSAVQLQR